MSADSQRAGELFEQAVQLGPEQRHSFLEAACGSDVELRAKVIEMLAFATQGDSAAATIPADLRAFMKSRMEGIGDRIGRYKILQKIGEGGCGVVYMAEQDEPVKRRVAVKVIKRGMDSRQVVARFEAERQALAMMDHPNIAKVLDAGETEGGQPFFAMELVKGLPITAYCDQEKLEPEDRLKLFIPVCHAVQHAHQKGIIHRDIKPSNVLVSFQDGTPVPKVIDFGIAKAIEIRLTDKTLFTAIEQFMGTPAYMSPEQAEMSSIDIDTRSDIYSLGVLLYELLTGVTPFDSDELLAAGIAEIRRKIREEEPMRPSTRLSTLVNANLAAIARARQIDAIKLIARVRGDLDWIVMKALEKDRTRRYESASGLAADLGRHLNQEPVTARPASTTYKIQKLVRRNKLIFAAGAAVLLSLIFGTVVSSWQAIRVTHAVREQERLRASESRLFKESEAARLKETVERLRAQKAYEDAAKTLDQNDLSKAESLFAASTPDPLTAIAWLGRVLRRTPGNRIAAARFLDTLTHQNIPLPIAAVRSAGVPRCLTFSRDNARLTIISSSGSLSVVQLPQGSSASFPAQTNGYYGAFFSKTGKLLIALFTAGESKGAVEIYDGNTFQLITRPALQISRPKSEAHPNDSSIFRNVLPSPDEQQLFVLSSASELRCLDIKTGHVLSEFRGPDSCEPLDITADGKFLLVASPATDELQATGTNVYVLESKTGQVRYSVPQRPRARFHGIAPFFSADGEFLYDFGGRDEELTLRWTKNGLPVCDPVRGIGPAGNDFIGLTPDGSIDQAAYSVLAPFISRYEGSPNFQTSLFSSDRSFLALPRQQGLIEIFDLRSSVPRYEATRRPVPPDIYPQEVVFTPDSQKVIFFRSDRKAAVFQTSSGSPLATIDFEERALSFQVSADSRYLAIALTNETASIWELESGLRAGKMFRQPLLSDISLSPDGSSIATISSNGGFSVWEVLSARLIWQGNSLALNPFPNPGVDESQFSLARSSASSFSWHKNGKTVAIGSTDGTVQIRDGLNGSLIFQFPAHGHPVGFVQYSPDGNLLLTSSADRTIRIWSTANWSSVAVPIEMETALRLAQFSMDGGRLLTLANDHTVKVWNSKTASAIAGPFKDVFAASLIADGALVAARDFALRVWDVETGQPLTSKIPLGSASPNGAFVARTDFDTGTELLPLNITPPFPVWLSQWAETASGLRVNDRGGVETLSFAEFVRNRDQILARREGDSFTQWARWFFADKQSRGINPVSAMTLPELRAKEPDRPDAAEISPTNGFIHALHALRLARSSASDDWLITALVEAEWAMRLAPQEPSSWVARATLMRKLAHADDALAALDRGRQFGGESAESWFLRATILEEKNQIQQAIDSYTQVIADEPRGSKLRSRAEDAKARIQTLEATQSRK